jgi:hypothetical protein
LLRISFVKLVPPPKENVKIYFKRYLERSGSNECEDSSSSSISASQRIYLNVAQQWQLTLMISLLGQVQDTAKDARRTANRIDKEVKQIFCLIHELLKYVFLCPTVLKDSIDEEEIQITKNNSTYPTKGIF